MNTIHIELNTPQIQQGCYWSQWKDFDYGQEYLPLFKSLWM